MAAHGQAAHPDRESWPEVVARFSPTGRGPAVPASGRGVTGGCRCTSDVARARCLGRPLGTRCLHATGGTSTGGTTRTVGNRQRWRRARRRRTPGAGRTGPWRSRAKPTGSRGARRSWCADVRRTCRRCPTGRAVWPHPATCTSSRQPVCAPKRGATAAPRAPLPGCAITGCLGRVPLGSAPMRNGAPTVSGYGPMKTRCAHQGRATR